jgi:small nuclear ribonucleoprotein G
MRKDKKKTKQKDKILPKQGYPADLAPFLSKQLLIIMNGNRRVIGKVTGYDHFMNLTIEEATEFVPGSGSKPIFTTVIRGESIIFCECMDRVESTQPKTYNNNREQ